MSPDILSLPESIWVSNLLFARAYYEFVYRSVGFIMAGVPLGWAKDCAAVSFAA